jgi:hypothetical protein
MIHSFMKLAIVEDDTMLLENLKLLLAARELPGGHLFSGRAPVRSRNPAEVVLAISACPEYRASTLSKNEEFLLEIGPYGL